MVRFIRKGYLKLKCKECHKSHTFDARDLVFDINGKTDRGDGLEKEYLCSNDFFCSCDTKIKSEIFIAEFPEGKIKDIRYETKNAEVTEKCTFSILSF